MSYPSQDDIDEIRGWFDPDDYPVGAHGYLEIPAQLEPHLPRDRGFAFTSKGLLASGSLNVLWERVA